ncbi:uncharacterized protein ISCGN_019443 [Ixodes scapularis]
MTVLDEENASVASTSGQRSVANERFTEDPVSDSPSSEGEDDPPSSEEAGAKRETVIYLAFHIEQSCTHYVVHPGWKELYALAETRITRMVTTNYRRGGVA